MHGKVQFYGFIKFLIKFIPKDRTWLNGVNTTNILMCFGK